MYINSIKAKESKFGIKLNCNIDNLIAELTNLKKDGAYCNLEITKRKEVGKYGETHSVKIDTWKPTPKAENNIQDSDFPF